MSGPEWLWLKVQDLRMGPPLLRDVYDILRGDQQVITPCCQVFVLGTVPILLTI